MAVYSVNQNRQFYVASAKPTATSTAPTTLGGLNFKKDAEGNLFFNYMGVDGLMRSDFINKGCLDYVTYTKASAMALKYKRVKVTLKNDYLADGNPISGQDYILRIFIYNYMGEGEKYAEAKYGAVRAYKGMTPKDFYVQMAMSLANNFAREAVPLLNFYLTVSTTDRVLVKAGAKKTDFSSIEADGIEIVEAVQPWELGTKKQTTVKFDVIPTTITYNGDEVTWGELDSATTALAKGDTLIAKYTTHPASAFVNGKAIADLEWFCMGERGDQYRNVGYPNVIKTTYLVDPTKEYNCVDIHYHFSDTGVNVQRSDKTITIVSTVDIEAVKTAIDTWNTSGTLTIK